MGSFIPAVARVAVLAATAMLASPVWADDLHRQVQNMLDDFREECSFPGATAAYVLPDGTSGTVATGLSDVEVIAPMTPQSRMLAASIGKSFAAATIATQETATVNGGDKRARLCGPVRAGDGAGATAGRCCQSES